MPLRSLISVFMLALTFAGQAYSQPAPPKVPPGHVLIPAGERMIVELSTTEREYILNEMRAQLDMLYVMTEGLSRGDMGTVAAAAARRGTDTLARPPASTYEKTPMAFQNMIRESRAKIDQMAVEARSNAAPALMLQRITELLHNCNSCHANWQLRVRASLPGKR